VRNSSSSSPRVFCAALLCLAGLSASAGAVTRASAASWAHAAPKPVAYPLTTSLDVTQQSRMVYANGELFVSDGPAASEVDVFTASGKPIHDIAGEPGADGMVLSADGTKLYVALSTAGQISVINTKTFAHHQFTVSACPTYLALVGSRLFYSFGCGAANDGGVSSVDAITGADPVIAVPALRNPPLVAGGGTTLAVADRGSTAAAITTYTVGGAGTVSSIATINDAVGVADISMTAAGTDLAVAQSDNVGFTEYETSDLSVLNTFSAVASPTAVALTPGGKRLVGGLSATGDLVNFYSLPVGAPLWQRFGATSAPSTWTTGVDDEVLPGSLAFASDGSHVYGLVEPVSGTGVWLFASSAVPVASSIHLTVSHPAAGHPIVATATVSAAGQVEFIATSNGASSVVGMVRVNSQRTAVLSFPSEFSGSVVAAYLGDQSHDPKQTHESFTVPATSDVALSGWYKSRAGVRLFHKRADVHIAASVTPLFARRSIVATLSYRVAGHWHAVSHLSQPLTAAGTVAIGLRKIATHYHARVSVSFAGDSLNGPSTAVSRTFEVT
jgi:hypothetical protein